MYNCPDCGVKRVIEFVEYAPEVAKRKYVLGYYVCHSCSKTTDSNRHPITMNDGTTSWQGGGLWTED